MSIYINDPEKAILTQVGIDSNEANLNGICGGTFASAVFPVIVPPPTGPYSNVVKQTGPYTPEEEKRRNQVFDGTAGFFAGLFRTVSPIAESQVDIVSTPNTIPAIIDLALPLISYTIPNPLYASRRLLVTSIFSCSATVTGKVMEYWIDYNPGTGLISSPHYRLRLPRPNDYFSAASEFSLSAGERNGSSGIVTLTTASPHGIIPGDAFSADYNSVGTAAGLTSGIKIATAGTTGSTIYYQDVVSPVAPTLNVGVAHTYAKDYVHTQVTGTWAINMPPVIHPASNAPIKLYAQDMTGGSGAIQLTVDDTISISITG
jgi:hypothetical protein